MIIKYNLFLAESITMSNEDVVDILKSLETEDNKNSVLINRLINKVDNKGKSVLMTIVQSNNEELVDYILKFNVDINHTIKTGENVLFFCKSIKMFKKFYELGVDVHAKNIYTKQNVLSYLSSKKLFNVELYQKMINDGIEISSDILCASILNKGIVELLVKNKINLNEKQHCFLYTLFDQLRYNRSKKTFIFNIFKFLFENKMKIIDIKHFSTYLIELKNYPDYNDDLILEFIRKLSKYITNDMILEIYKRYCDIFYDVIKNVDFAKKLLDIELNIDLYNYLKQYYKSSNPNFYILFDDFIEANPWIENAKKYNI